MAGRPCTELVSQSFQKVNFFILVLVLEIRIPNKPYKQHILFFAEFIFAVVDIRVAKVWLPETGRALLPGKIIG
jgi:hypothetical protein